MVYRFVNLVIGPIHFSPSPDDTHRLCELIREDRGEGWCDYMDIMKQTKGKNAIWYLEHVLERLEQAK